MARIYRYILTHDYGVAPCPENGLISLATCKPVIRRCASVGDWVLGFRPGSLERGVVLWAGRVSRKLTHGEYQREFSERLDAVYRETKTGTYVRLVEDYHPTLGEMERDLSAPVLLFEEGSVYLSGQPEVLPPELMHLAAAGRGHRVNGTGEGDVERLAAWVGTLQPPPIKTVARSRSCTARVRRTGCGDPPRRVRSC